MINYNVFQFVWCRRFGQADRPFDACPPRELIITRIRLTTKRSLSKSNGI